MKISVVIPVLYSPKNLVYKDAIKSILSSWKKSGQKKSDLEIIVVFNQFDGKDFSLPKKNENNIFYLKNRINRGFTGGVNDGVFYSIYSRSADWCLVTNDDVIFDESFFSKMIPQLKISRAVVSCGVRDKDGFDQSRGMNYFRSGLTSPLVENKKTPYFVGTVFFVSKKTVLWSFDKFGFLLMEFFFAYAEDLELSVRLKKANRKVFILKDNLITHLGSLTAKRGSAKQLFWGYRNLIFIILIHWSLFEIILFSPLLLLGQIYSIALLFKKRHFLVYPKIIWSVVKHRRVVLGYRRSFHKI
jgi:GT2 family glycosyltransferase